MRLRIFRNASIVALVLQLSACGYSVARNKGLTAGGGRIFVPMAENLTTQVGLEAPLTSSLRESLEAVPDLHVSANEEDANYLLLTTIESYGTQMQSPSSRATSDDEARGGLVRDQTSAADIKVAITVRVDLYEKLSPLLKKKMWTRTLRQERSFDAFTRFDDTSGAASAPFIQRSREHVQLRAMSEELARRIIDQVVEDF